MVQNVFLSHSPVTLNQDIISDTDLKATTTTTTIIIIMMMMMMMI